MIIIRLLLHLQLLLTGLGFFLPLFYGRHAACHVPAGNRSAATGDSFLKRRNYGNDDVFECYINAWLLDLLLVDTLRPGRIQNSEFFPFKGKSFGWNRRPESDGVVAGAVRLFALTDAGGCLLFCAFQTWNNPEGSFPVLREVGVEIHVNSRNFPEKVPGPNLTPFERLVLSVIGEIIPPSRNPNPFSVSYVTRSLWFFQVAGLVLNYRPGSAAC